MSYNLPTEWRITRLRDVAFESRERNSSLRFGRHDIHTVDNQRGLISSNRMLGEEFSRYKTVAYSSFAYNPMRLNVGSIALWPQNRQVIVSPDYVVFSCDEKALFPPFLDFLRRTAVWKSQISQSGQGSVRIRYYFHHIGNFVLPLPPLREQRAIAAVLRTVERAKEACEQIIGATRALKQSLLQYLFTYGPVPFNDAERVKTNETGEGTFPDDWARQTLGELCTVGNGSIQTGPFGSQLHKSDYKTSGIPVVNPTHLNGNRINHQDLPRIEKGKAEELARHRLRRGDILFARRGEIGRLGFVTPEEDGWQCGTGCFLVRVGHPNIHNAYLPWFFQRHEVVEWLTANAAGAIMPNLSATTLSRLPVLFPSLVEQEVIAFQLTVVDNKIATEEARCAALDRLFQSLLHNLITGRLRVNHLVEQLDAEATRETR